MDEGNVSTNRSPTVARNKCDQLFNGPTISRRIDRLSLVLCGVVHVQKVRITDVQSHACNDESLLCLILCELLI